MEWFSILLAADLQVSLAIAAEPDEPNPNATHCASPAAAACGDAQFAKNRSYQTTPELTLLFQGTSIHQVNQIELRLE